MNFELLLKQMHIDLEKFKFNNPDILELSNLSILSCKNVLNIMSKYISNTCFIDVQDEIYFFKYIKVEPMCYLIYNIEVRSSELRLPKIGKEEQLKFLNFQIKKVNTFFDRHTEFQLYMEQGYTHFDEHYFTRKHLGKTHTVKSYPYYKDPLFNTSHDEIWARIKGLEHYVNYLKKKRGQLEKGGNNKKNSELKWTGTYAAFVEMIYGCQAMGYFNDGNIDIKKVIGALGDFLNVNRGNSSRTYYEIKARKGSRTKFFDETGQKLLRKMDDEDGIE